MGLLVFFLACTAASQGSARQYFVSPVGNDAAVGTKAAPLRTIQEGANRAMPGDEVIATAGIYRERVSPPRSGDAGNPITYRASYGEPVAIRGSEAVLPSEWTLVKGDASARSQVYKTSVKAEWLQTLNGAPFNPYSIGLGRPGKETRIASRNNSACYFGRSLGQVFEEGRLMDEADSPARIGRGSWAWSAADNGTEIFASFGGRAPRSPEVTVRNRVFAPHQRGIQWIVVEGFVLEHASNQWDDDFWLARRQPNNPSPAAFAQAGLLGTRSGRSWVIRNNTIRHAKTIGLDIGDEGGTDPEGEQGLPYKLGNHTIEFNHIVSNGGKGITGEFGTVGPQPLFHDPSTGKLHQQPCPGCEVHRNWGGRIAFNVFKGNNYLICDAEEYSQLKTHGYSGEVIGNLIIGNDYGPAVWFDDLWWHLRVSRNVVLHQSSSFPNAGPFAPPVDPGSFGMMFEISTGPGLVDNNVLIYPGTEVIHAGMGANNLTLVQNLIVNSGGGIGINFAGVDDRSYNDRQDDTPVDVPWLSYGCGLKPTNASTMKNMRATGNIVAGNPWASVSDTNGTGGHVCCNNTLSHNVYGGTDASSPGNNNVGPVKTYDVMVTENMQLWFKKGPELLQSGAPHGPGTEYDFYGQPRGEGTLQAGPFQFDSGSLDSAAFDLLPLWPPPEWEDFERRYIELSDEAQLSYV